MRRFDLVALTFAWAILAGPSTAQQPADTTKLPSALRLEREREIA